MLQTRYCGNCGGTLAGPSRQCPTCGVSLKEGGQGSESDRRTKQGQWEYGRAMDKERDAAKRKEEADWARAMRSGRARLETLQQYCGLMHLLTDDGELSAISARLGWLAMEPNQRRGYVEPRWGPDGSSDTRRKDAGMPTRRTLLTIANALWTWRAKHWDRLVKAVLQPDQHTVKVMAERALNLSADSPDQNLQYLGAVLHYERLSRRQLTVRGKVAAIVGSARTWRLTLAAAGACAGYWLVAGGGLAGWWWAGIVLGAIAGLLVAGAAGRLVRRIGTARRARR